MSVIYSREKLQNVHPDLVRLVERISLTIPVKVLYGYRSEIEQLQAFQSGHSKLPWPKSKHNKMPSEAVDLSPYPYTENLSDLYYFSGFVMGAAAQLGIKIRSGSDWNRNAVVSDEKFHDLYHFELDGYSSEAQELKPV